MVNSVTHSYEYSALCDVCKFKFKASQLRLRWDGLQVCKWDWEPRHPSDFYRGRNDSHKLPWTRPDDGADPSLHWAGSIAALVLSAATGESAVQGQGDYRIDGLLGKTYGNIQLVQWADNVSNINLIIPQSRTTNAAGTFNLPTVPTTGGTLVLRSSYKVLEVDTIVAGNINVSTVGWTSVPGSVYASFSYGT
jgi:hypothetical protein